MAVRDWEAARDVFSEALGESESGEALEGLSWVAFWTGDADTVFRTRERAYALYREAGRAADAARLAIWIGCDHADFRGDYAISQGWYARAERLLTGLDPVPEHGWLAFQTGAYAIELADDTTTARERARETARVGHALGDVDLQVLGLALEGLARVTEGEVDEGMRCLDEAAVAVTGGEVREHVTSTWTLCYVIYACERVRDFDRAAQWCKRMEEVSMHLSFELGIGVCRAHYAGVLILKGDWPSAEAELARAAAGLERSGRLPATAESAARLGELRRRQGRVEEAAELFERTRPHPVAELGTAALALDERDAGAALDILDSFLAVVPATSHTQRADALELAVAARLALGDLDGAAEAAWSLEGIATTVATRPLLALAAKANGAVEAAKGDQAAARRRFEVAVDLFERSGLPYEASLARIELASALVSLGRTEAAARQTGMAAARMTELGARALAERAARCLAPAPVPASVGGSTPNPLSPREIEVLRLVCEGLSDRQIGERLHISPHTVHRHVSSILTKLGLPSRAAAAAHAAKLGLA